ncbi:putative G-patch domain, winged helix-turn-helix DNA-binding domain-containing protein [Lupinus albus]|uniref:Putative G-patch domain, winged helix-turn-helix DNA-binding domain-containing protein n=1 Tax=Lupinus albus TaxID=3870 RepID=A0A6A4PTR1_LUPAL|nr:putative G-patch domain, winged helix-turn-helix DNA-binding domain-containing protein [Lupinus albus]
MGDSESGRGKSIEEEDDDDYMADLSRFLPSEDPQPISISSSKKIIISSKKDTPPIKSSKNHLKTTLSWQDRRKLHRERKQQKEDEQTLAKVELPIPQSNIGFKLLKQMGYTPGSSLGKNAFGIVEPVGIQIRRSRAGIGLEDPQKEKRKKEEIMLDRKRKKDEVLMEEFGSRQKSLWQSKRIVINFNKAKAALDQLENRQVVETQKNEDDLEDEEEEEKITEEELHDVLMKLRDDFNYCLFCGCKYESKDALLDNCPGTNEDDH